MTIAAAETRAAHFVESKEVKQAAGSYPVAISIRTTYEQVASVSGVDVALRRPRKKAPVPDEDSLRCELEAWDAATDEAFREE